MKIKNNTKFFIFFCLLFLGFFAGTQKVEAANCAWLVPFKTLIAQELHIKIMR